MGFDLYDGESDTVFYRIGNAQQPGSVADDWPDTDEFGIVSEGYIPGHQDGSGGVIEDEFGNTHAITFVDVEDLPEEEPLAVGIYFDPLVDADTPVNLKVVIKNTISTAVSFAGALTLPSQWVVLSGGSTSLAGSLDPAEEMIREYLILPQQIPCEWVARG